MSKAKDTKHVSFRTPTDLHRDYAEAAAYRGMDLSALLNWVLVEYRPTILRQMAEHRDAMLQAQVPRGKCGRAYHHQDCECGGAGGDR